MAGPGKGNLKRSDLQMSSSSHTIQKHHKSTSSHTFQPRQKSTKNNTIQPPQKSTTSHTIQPPQKSTSSHTIQPPQKSISSHTIQPPQKSTNSHTIQKRHKSTISHTIQPPQISTSSHTIQPPQKSNNNQNLPNLQRSTKRHDFLIDDQQEDQQTSSTETEANTSNPQQEENTFSASYGTSITRKESRVLSETRKKRSKKRGLIFEVDECAGRIVGEDSQRFISKGGCLVRGHALFDGTTWKKHEDLLKEDIILKCTENSNFDPTCPVMVRAMYTQLGNQHKSRQHRLHLHYKKYSTKEEATKHPPNGVTLDDWTKLCNKFASESFQNLSRANKENRSKNEVPPAVGTVSIARIVDMKRREGEEVSAIDNYKIGHFSRKKNEMINEKAGQILNELLSEEASSSCSPTEICLKKLNRIPGHARGRSTSKKHILATENLRLELECEKSRSQALEEKVLMMEKEHTQHKDEMKEQMDFMMKELKRLSALQPEN